MTHQQKLKAVREAIIAIIPDILKLQFGCRIRVEHPHPDIEVVIEPGLHIDDVYTLESGIREKGEYEILGRPINLADVLLAIGKDNTSDCYNLLQDWNLSKNLEDQEPPVILFLYDVLCEKNL